jgi:hypothetical protein
MLFVVGNACVMVGQREVVRAGGNGTFRISHVTLD